jgi:hypothetical protein
LYLNAGLVFLESLESSILEEISNLLISDFDSYTDGADCLGISGGASLLPGGSFRGIGPGGVGAAYSLLFSVFT